MWEWELRFWFVFLVLEMHINAALMIGDISYVATVFFWAIVTIIFLAKAVKERALFITLQTNKTREVK